MRQSTGSSGWPLLVHSEHESDVWVGRDYRIKIEGKLFLNIYKMKLFDVYPLFDIEQMDIHY